MNEHSSRSHAIFTITIERSEKGIDGQQHVRMGKLHMVDLAVSQTNFIFFCFFSYSYVNVLFFLLMFRYENIWTILIFCSLTERIIIRLIIRNMA